MSFARTVGIRLLQYWFIALALMAVIAGALLSLVWVGMGLGMAVAVGLPAGLYLRLLGSRRGSSKAA